MLHMCVLGTLVAIVGLFIGLILNEKVIDEREIIKIGRGE